MIGLRNYMQNGSGTAEINIAPLIDMVFILLIFFLVTASFVSESGIDVNRPQAASATTKPATLIQVGISASGDIHVDGRQVGVLALRSFLRSKMRDDKKEVLLIADVAVRSGVLVEVMDECYLAGATRVSLATEEK